MIGICKIFATASELQKYNTNVTINKHTMIIHSLLLTLHSFVAIVFALVPYIPVFFNHSSLISVVATIVDMIVQLMICYICLTMSSHVHLRKFQMTLDLTSGVPKVVFSRISESLIESQVENFARIGDETGLSSFSSQNTEL